MRRTFGLTNILENVRSILAEGLCPNRSSSIFLLLSAAQVLATQQPTPNSLGNSWANRAFIITKIVKLGDDNKARNVLS